MEPRLPAHVEVSGLIRSVQSAGGFATILKKGERDAGTILIVGYRPNAASQLWERMPQLDGTRPYVETRIQDPENPAEFNQYLTRRGEQDPDIWILELDIADAQQFVAVQHKSD